MANPPRIPRTSTGLYCCMSSFLMAAETNFSRLNSSSFETKEPEASLIVFTVTMTVNFDFGCLILGVGSLFWIADFVSGVFTHAAYDRGLGFELSWGLVGLLRAALLLAFLLILVVNPASSVDEASSIVMVESLPLSLEC